MVKRTNYPSGAPCWVDVSVPDRESAQRFYGGVFGWKFVDQGADAGHYTMCELDGVPVAGMMQPPQDGAEMPPQWSVYLSTGDVDRAVRTVTGNGGRLMVDPMDVMDAGRMAFGIDPAGAVFGMWQPGRHIGSQRWGDPGSVGWSELITRDGGTADAFYQSIFDYDRQEQLSGGDVDYSIWSAGGEQVCGRWATADQTPQWSTYFSVRDTDRSIETVSEQGGRVEREPWDTPYGRMATVTDPWGAQFYLAGPTNGH
ncbi:MAG: VOC family protein [Actinocatenispora sp.]